MHLNDINKAEIKSIESQINQLVSKSMDMKDILQDYIEWRYIDAEIDINEIMR